MSEWQPIETAPRDGTHMLLFREHVYFIGYWATKAQSWRVNADGLPMINPPPTHWMPLPEPPA